MSIELDAEAIRSFVAFRHRSLPPRREIPPRADPAAVGRLAARLAARVLGGVCDGDQVRVAECSGLLLYAMDGYGMTYEEVCQLASHKVAEVLRQVTPDHRQTAARRHLALRSALGQADALTLVVKLAEVSLTAESLARVPAPAPALAADIKYWADHAGPTLEAMRALRELPRMQATLAEARDAVAALGRATARPKTRARRPHADAESAQAFA